MRRLERFTTSKKLAAATLLGTIAFVSTGFLPTPFDKIFLAFQALTFSLGSLMVRYGGTYTSLVNGILLSILRTSYFPFSLIFSVFYGLVIDGLYQVFRVKQKHVQSSRLTASLVIGTTLIGLSSMYLSTLVGLMPMLPVLYLAIIIIGVPNAVVASYLTLLIWNRYLAHYDGSA